ncbi:MAG: hypothetical protein KC535_00650 [Nanoarchaeota archaeon]|nr:hypothetical protein [Nanoarchaeota archaeon]
MKGDEGARLHDKESALYQQQLESYILTNLKQGYTPDQIKEYLHSKGYDPSSVKLALASVNQKYYGSQLEIHQPSTRGTLLISLLIGIILLGVGAFFLFSYQPYQSSISLSDVTISGQTLSFDVLTNREILVEFSVTTKTGNFVLQKSETFTSTSSYDLLLPENLPLGDYLVTAKTKFKEQRQDTLFPFRKTATLQTTPATGQSSSSTTSFSSAISSLDKNQCENLADSSQKDECYFVIARDIPDETICELIKDMKKKESCYLTQVLNGKTISCTLLEEPQNTAICQELSS